MSIDLRQLLVGKQRQLSTEFEAARAALEHPGAKGDGAEMDWRTVVKEFLPERYEVSRAFVLDADGEPSEQLDVVIHDRHYCPLLFERGGHCYIPAESVYAVFDVKQEIKKGTIDEAAQKVQSVRRLRRTSVDIPHAGGTYDAIALEPILGGILAGVSSWTDPLGDRLEDALTEAPDKLDLGCTLLHGAFEAEWPADGETPNLVKSDPDVGLIFFLVRLFTRLRAMRTVPAIDLEEYARTLEQNA